MGQPAVGISRAAKPMPLQLRDQDRGHLVDADALGADAGHAQVVQQAVEIGLAVRVDTCVNRGKLINVGHRYLQLPNDWMYQSCISHVRIEYGSLVSLTPLSGLQ